MSKFDDVGKAISAVGKIITLLCILGVIITILWLII